MEAMNSALHHHALSCPPPIIRVGPRHSHTLSYPQPSYDDPSPPYTALRSTYNSNDHFEVSPEKRLRVSGPQFDERRIAKRQQSISGTDTELLSPVTPDSIRKPPSGEFEAVGSGAHGGEKGRGKSSAISGAVKSTTAKSRRVRTGCLTCRERHLKCDEGLPDCNNCRKSSRNCKRGVRLNFIDIQVKDPPFIPPTREWSGTFSQSDVSYLTPPSQTLAAHDLALTQ